jgi:hypothetical protein
MPTQTRIKQRRLECDTAKRFILAGGEWGGGVKQEKLPVLTCAYVT